MSSKVLWNCLIISICITMIAIPSIAEDTKYPFTITDSAGREVTISRPIERIIPMNTNAAEVVVMLGAANRVVAVDEDIKKKSEMPETLKVLPTVGKWNDPDFEMIGEIAREGDRIVPNILVIAYPEDGLPQGADSIEKGLTQFENITVVGFKLSRPENMAEEITKLGKILGSESEADDYLNWYQENSDNVSNAVNGRTPPNVYIEWNANGGLGALATIGNASAVDNQIRFAGGDNIANVIDSTEFMPKVTWEWVTTKNPDVIIRLLSLDKLGWETTPSSDDQTTLETVRNEIINRPGASELNAVKNDRVYVLSSGVFYGLDSIVGLNYLAEIFYPDLDLSPKTIYKEYLSRMGVEYPTGTTLAYPSDFS